MQDAQGWGHDIKKDTSAEANQRRSQLEMDKMDGEWDGI